MRILLIYLSLDLTNFGCIKISKYHYKPLIGTGEPLGNLKKAEL